MQNKTSLINNRRGIASTLITALLWILIVLAVIHIAFALTYVKVYVVGSSMSGTLTGAPDIYSGGGDYVYAFRSSDPHRGDIVVVNTGEKVIIKRVIGLGGDTVELRDGVLYLNGEIKAEPYVDQKNNTPSENNFPLTTVPEGCMFCMGDNRDNSKDSRYDYGCMPTEWTVGVVADWSMSFKGIITSFNTFFDYAVPNAFR